MFNAEQFVADHQGMDVFKIIELAYTVGRIDGHSKQLDKVIAELKQLIKENEDGNEDG